MCGSTLNLKHQLRVRSTQESLERIERGCYVLLFPITFVAGFTIFSARREISQSVW